MKKSTEHFFKNLASCVKEKTSFILEGETLIFEPPKEIIVASSFFKNALCAMCGSCCHKGISPLVYSNSDIEEMIEMLQTKDIQALQELSTGLKKIPVDVNGKEKSVWFYEFEGFRCGFDKLIKGDDTWGCPFHDNVQVLQCMMPWIRVSTANQKTILCKRPFGYAWSFGCQGYWGEGFNEEKFLSRDLKVVERLSNYSKDLEVETYWPEILIWLKEWYNKYTEGSVGIPSENLSLFRGSENPKEIFDSKRFF